MNAQEVDKRIARALAGLRLPFRVELGLIDTLAPVQIVEAQGLAGETLNDHEIFQHYGFTSAPPPESQGLVLPIGGRTAQGIVIATEHGDYRFKVTAPGEVALYTDEGDYIYFKRGHVIEVKAGAEVKVDAPLAHFTGDVVVDGNLNVLGQIDGGVDITAAGNIADQGGAKTMSGMRGVFNAHTHHENDVHGNTNGPNSAM